MDRPIKVAVIGGGCASIATAFELSRPEHEGRYEVTVYQLGWRLGGKGASGRGEAGRIEEHGLHLWMGHYDNAFHLMRECYRELGRDPETCPIVDWTDAFQPDPHTGLADQLPDGTWQLLTADFPGFAGMPGDTQPEDSPRTVQAYLVRAVKLLSTLVRSTREIVTIRKGQAQDPESAAETAETITVERATEEAARLVKYGQLATLTAVLQALSVLEQLLSTTPGYARDGVVPRLIDSISDGARKVLTPLLDGDPESRFLWEVIDVILATIRGSIRFDLANHPRGFEAIDEYDSREWLMMNGASERSVNCTFIRGLYDLAFAYEDGDPNRPRNAAGQGLRGIFRMFLNYRGALFWKMRAGMGDVVFAPFYEVLRKRGVRFEFFHRLENVSLADGEKPYVDALEFDVQAKIAGGGEYDPLVDVKGLPCWPSWPRWEQLEEGEGLRADDRRFESFWDRRFVEKKTLTVGKDFDLVVLGVSVGTIPHVCPEFLERDARWRTMVAEVKTVATQAAQIWLDCEMKELGWHEPPITVAGFRPPLGTWADMTHLVPVEAWQRDPGAIIYLCNVFPTGPTPDRSQADYPAKEHERVRRNAIEFLNEHAVQLWPDAQRAPGRFRWELLADPRGSTGKEGSSADESRFDSQFWCANVNPSDRYVLSLPGSLKHRISPLDDTYDNLTITGDWTDCGFNFGCVEAAVMSGRLAAHAVSLSPRLEDIFGYDHP